MDLQNVNVSKAYLSKKREMYRLHALLWQNTNFSLTNKKRFSYKLVLMKRQTLAVGVLAKLYLKTCQSQAPQIRMSTGWVKKKQWCTTSMRNIYKQQYCSEFRQIISIDALNRKLRWNFRTSDRNPHNVPRKSSQAPLRNVLEMSTWARPNEVGLKRLRDRQIRSSG